MTRLTLRAFVSAWYHHRCSVKGAIDALCSDLPEEFYLPLSTAYSWLSVVREWCRKQAVALGLDVNGLKCLEDLKRVAGPLVLGVVDRPSPHILEPP